MDDEELIAMVAAGFDEIGPAPAAALELAVASIGMRDLDDRLADLVFDSWSEDQQVAMRSTSIEARQLSFEGGDVTLDVELHPVDPADGRLIGQITPQGVHHVRIERAGGEVLQLDTDDLGRFRAVVPAGPIRLRVGDALVTPWMAR